MLLEMGKRARAAARVLGRTPSEVKNAVLASLAENIMAQSEAILEANQLDIDDGEAAGLTPALIERLTLNMTRLEGIAADLQNVISLPDPVGRYSMSARWKTACRCASSAYHWVCLV